MDPTYHLTSLFLQASGVTSADLTEERLRNTLRIPHRGSVTMGLAGGAQHLANKRCATPTINAGI